MIFVVCSLVFADAGEKNTFVAVVETRSTQNALKYEDCLFLTDKLRERAKKVLPAYMNYVIMTRENIDAMLDPSKKSEDCENECLVELGRNISADFIAQARVGKFGESLTLTVELYDTRSKNLVNSFTAQKADANELLKEIELQADAFFGVIVKGEATAASDGFGNISMGGGSDFELVGSRQVIVNVQSEPTGALVSVDGKPSSQCASTPCKVQLTSGYHRLTLVKELYMDTTFEVTPTAPSMYVVMKPNYGVLKIEPKMDPMIESFGNLAIEIDGKSVREREVRLAPGAHKVALSHKCFENVSFDMSIKNGSELTFDKAMVPYVGGLELTASQGDAPLELPVYVNGAQVGMTPYLGKVPVCAKVAVGGSQEQLDVDLKAKETVTYNYEVPVGRSNRNFENSGGISGLSMGGFDYQLTVTKNYTLDVESDPSGATFVVDGVKNEVCNKTPCKIELKEGRHSFKFKNDQYFDGDTAIGLHSTGTLKYKLMPQFGIFELAPKLVGGIGSKDSLKMTWNGKEIKAGTWRAPPGTYKVTINHRCYEPVSFNVTVDYASYAKFEETLLPVTGGLSLSAEGVKGEPLEWDVYVNGNKKGKTPFLGKVPVCALVGFDMYGGLELPLKAHETIEYKHSMKNLAKMSKMKDPRDGKEYKIVTIMGQTWMAENLNYRADGSWCYKDDYAYYCEKYGRLYKWSTAMNACPSGWHLPSDQEFSNLWSTIGGKDKVGEVLKSSSGWNSNGNGEDTFGFAVLPAGRRNYNYGGGYFDSEGDGAYFWSSTEYSYGAYYWSFYYNRDDVRSDYYDKNYGYSVRCLRD